MLKCRQFVNKNVSIHFALKFEQPKASNLLFILLSLGETSKSYCQETQKKSRKILEKMKMNLLIVAHSSRLIKKQRKKLEIFSKFKFHQETR